MAGTFYRLDAASSQNYKEEGDEEEMTKDRSDQERHAPRPQERPQERPRPSQDEQIRKDSGNNIRTTDWSKPPRKDKDA